MSAKKGMCSAIGIKSPRPRPFPDHVLQWCCRHLGLAVLRRRGEKDDRELNDAFRNYDLRAELANVAR
jgi:hypothetical protein